MMKYILLIVMIFSGFIYSQGAFTKRQKAYIKNAVENSPDTSDVPSGYVLKYIDGVRVWSPDISTSGSGTFNPDGITLEESGGVARLLPAYKTRIDDADITDLIDGELSASKVGGVKDADYGDVTVSVGSWLVEDDSHNHVISNVDALQDSLTSKMNRSEMASYSKTTHTHAEFFDTLAISFGVMDTVITGDYSGWKVPNNITITEISAYTNSGSVTFNIEERGETTPNTAGTDVMGSDLVADTNQEETSSFTNATLDRNDWLVMNVTSISGDPTIFGVTIRYVKSN